MSALNQFLAQRLQSDHSVPQEDPESPPWWEDGQTVEIDQQTYYRYLDMLPPRYMDGDLFAFAEGAGNFVLFWRESTRYFAHPLSDADTAEFSALTRVPLHQ